GQGDVRHEVHIRTEVLTRRGILGVGRRSAEEQQSDHDSRNLPDHRTSLWGAVSRKQDFPWRPKVPLPAPRFHPCELTFGVLESDPSARQLPLVFSRAIANSTLQSAVKSQGPVPSRSTIDSAAIACVTQPVSPSSLVEFSTTVGTSRPPPPLIESRTTPSLAWFRRSARA